MKKCIVLLAFVLSACSTVSGIVQTPAQRVFAIESGYVAALQVAVAYKRLTPCTPNHEAGYLCSKPEIVGRLQKADDAAFALLQGAQNTVRAGGGNLNMAVTAAQQAVAAFTTITATLSIK